MSKYEIRKKAVENYVKSYNDFDVENMLKDLDENMVFRNIADGTVNLTTEGIAEFREQAERAVNLFSQREQKITRLKFSENEVEAEISYSGIIAVDLPDDKIVEIEDIG
jgi:hypothetical protein